MSHETVSLVNESGFNLSGFLASPNILRSETAKLQRSIAWETMVHRGLAGFAKYGTYFGFMWAAGLKFPDEARLFKSANFYWRYIDDVADKDRQVPFWYENRAEFLQSKKTIIQRLFFEPDGADVYGDREDILLADYYHVAKKLNLDLGQESMDILDSIIFDEERARHRRSLPAQDLHAYFELLDSACIKGALKAAKENAISASDRHPLSMAVRTMFNLRDFPKDFRDGLINISIEDIERCGIDLNQLADRPTVRTLIAYSPMRAWYQDQTRVGLDYLRESTNHLKEFELRRATRIVLGMHFEGPSRKNLTKYAKMMNLKLAGKLGETELID